MKFKRIEHVAIAVNDMEKMRDIFENKLGIEMEYEEDIPEYKTKLAMYPVGETYLEVLESYSPETETSKWISGHGEGLFHICLEVENIEGALSCYQKGLERFGQLPDHFLQFNIKEFVEQMERFYSNIPTKKNLLTQDLLNKSRPKIQMEHSFFEKLM